MTQVEALVYVGEDLLLRDGAKKKARPIETSIVDMSPRLTISDIHKAGVLAINAEWSR